MSYDITKLEIHYLHRHLKWVERKVNSRIAEGRDASQWLETQKALTTILILLRKLEADGIIFGKELQMSEDLIRDLKKVDEAVTMAFEYLRLVNEANSKLHCSAEVLQSPLTTKLAHAKLTLRSLLND